MDDERELEVIRHDMEHTRESLAHKLEALEHTIEDKVHGATEAVTQTVEAVQDTVQTVTETVSETFNVSAHVRKRPWLMVGGAFALGCLGGYLLGGKRERAPASAAPGHDYTPVSPALSHDGSHAGNGHAGVSSQEEGESNSLSEGLQMIQGLAVGALMGLLREAIAKALPNEWQSDVSNVVDNWTTRLGGKPLRHVEQPAGSRFASLRSENGEGGAMAQSATQQKWQGRWEQLKGRVKSLWGTITDDELTKVEGDYERLLGVLHERTGKTREEIERMLEEEEKK